MARRRQSRCLPPRGRLAYRSPPTPSGREKTRFSFECSQLRKRRTQFLVVRRPVVPQELVLHEVHAFAFDRVGDDARGLSSLQRHAAERSPDLVKIVPVDFTHRPAEGFPFLREWLQIEDLLHGSQALNLVVINDGNQMVQTVVGSEQRSLPDRSFIAFTVTY